MENPARKLDERIGPTSPLPAILQLRNWIFGLKSPNFIIRIGFYCLTIVGIIFLVWNVLSFIALQMRFLVRASKNISISEFLSERAIELEIHPDYILPKLLTYFSIAAICWGVFLFALVLLWRKKKMFFWVGAVALVFHIGMGIFYVGGLYFWAEISNLDKLVIFSSIAALAFYRFFQFPSGTSSK